MKYRHILYLLTCLLLVDCGGRKTVKPVPPAASKTSPAKPTQTTPIPIPAPQAKQEAPSSPPPAVPAPTAQNTPPAESVNKPGGYYLDDGPEAIPPANLDSIPDAVPKQEPLLPRSNRPYKALGALYKPMTSAQAYKMRGVASWYGKRFHGKKTSSGEIYNMYAMTAAHTILPLPSYARVTNVANGKSVVVRVNDRGPFKKDRIIDLSYVAAYKLGLIAKGSGLVEVEALHPDKLPGKTVVAEVLPPQSAAPESTVVTQPVVTNSPVVQPVQMQQPTTPQAPEVVQVNAPAFIPTPDPAGSTSAPTLPTPVTSTYNAYFVQAGAFKSEMNAENLIKRISALEIAQNVGVSRVYNNNFHRLRLGPFETRNEADQAAVLLRKQLNIPTIVLNQ